MTRVVLVPGVLALLPEYAGLEDPVAELRSACLSAVAWLGPGPITVLADSQGARVAKALLSACGGFEMVPEEVAQQPSRRAGASAPSSTTGAGLRRSSTTGNVLVVGNGSACRTEKAPGHLDARSHDFDSALGASLRAGRPEVDVALACDLWASVDGIARMAELGDLGAAEVDYDDDPFGVQYWVLRWQP